VAKREGEPAKNKRRRAVEVVKQVQRESENRECQAFAMIEEAVELVIQYGDHSEQDNDQ
jgi:hypothetical protein